MNGALPCKQDFHWSRWPARSPNVPRKSATSWESVLERLIRGGDYSRYGAANAVTNLANDLEDFDRIHTLEQMGGWLFTQISNAEWQKVALAA